MKARIFKMLVVMGIGYVTNHLMHVTRETVIKQNKRSNTLLQMKAYLEQQGFEVKENVSLYEVNGMYKAEFKITRPKGKDSVTIHVERDLGGSIEIVNQ